MNQTAEIRYDTLIKTQIWQHLTKAEISLTSQPNIQLRYSEILSNEHVHPIYKPFVYMPALTSS
jgi:hypothetical protein